MVFFPPEADHLYVFLCSGRSLPEWRRDLGNRGLDVQMYLGQMGRVKDDSSQSHGNLRENLPKK